MKKWSQTGHSANILGLILLSIPSIGGVRGFWKTRRLAVGAPGLEEERLRTRNGIRHPTRGKPGPLA